MKTDHVFKQFNPKPSKVQVTDDGPTGVLPRNFACLRKIIKAYESECGTIKEYALKYVRLIVEACESLPENDSYADEVAQKIMDSCSH